MDLIRSAAVALERLGLDEDTLDGPFLLKDGSFGLLVSLRGKDGGAMLGPTQLAWRRDVPTRMETEPVHVFFRRGEEAIYLGPATVAKRGHVARDGFRWLFGLAERVEEPAWSELRAVAEAVLPPAPEEAIAKLSKPSTSAERLGALRVFAERWFGMPSAALPAEVIGPPPLALLYGLLGDRDPCVQNRLIAGAELALVDGKIVFYVENQGCCEWATEPSGEDPPVWVRYEHEWTLEAPSLSGFLLQLLVQEAVYGAPFGARNDEIDARSLAALRRRVPPLPLPSWETSKTQFLGADGIIGFVYPEGEALAVWLGAKDRERLEAIDELVEEWPEISF